VPAYHDSPNLVEIVRVKTLPLGFGGYLYLNAVEVDGHICNVRTVNIRPIADSFAPPPGVTRGSFPCSPMHGQDSPEQGRGGITLLTCNAWR
jgi:hypothetical protein